MTTDPLAPLLRALDAKTYDPPKLTKLATVTGVSAAGVLVQFDDESAASSKRYKSTHPCFVGMRVLMQRVGDTWMIDGDVNSDAAWINATLLNSWTNFSSGAYPLQYRRTDGIVSVRGIVVPAVSWTTVIATLPAGYRPGSLYWRCLGAQGGADACTQVDIAGTGSINAPVAAGTKGGVAVTYLEIYTSFPVEQ